MANPDEIEVIAETLLDLSLSATLLHFAAQQAGRLIGAVNEQNSGTWSVLNSLAQEGALTVPQLARMRPVSRQFIQSLVNELEAQGLVALHENPAHKRSRLVSLTQAGRDHHAEVKQRAITSLSSLAAELSLEEAQIAARVVKELREALLALAREAASE